MDLPDRSAPRVLIVDDYPANLLALGAVLAPLGVDVVEARSGLEAIARVEEGSFVVALVDVQMPEIDGFETARRIRALEHGRDLPIIFLTAIHSDEQYMREGYAVGAADYITKPFDANVVRARVKAFAGLSRQRDAMSARQMKLALESAPALIAIFEGTALVCDFANNAFRATYGGDDLAGKTASAIGIPQAVVDAIEQVRLSGHETTMTELAVELPKCAQAGVTDERIVNVTVQPLGGFAGAVDAVMVFAVDVTQAVRGREERSALLARERVARNEAEIASRAKDEFLATVSHELRTPLNAILGWTLAAKRDANDKVRRSLAVVERNARAQARIIEDVLDISRIVSGKLRLDVTAVDVPDLIAGAVEAVRPAADAKGVRLEMKADHVGAIAADTDRLQQIVWNLMSNAIKFTPSGGRVEVSASRSPSHLSIRVADTGEGIEPGFLAHLFEPFKQADGSATRRHGGLGLGLAIVRQLVHAHGGTIRAESEGIGRGATFIIDLPATRVIRPATLGPRKSEDSARIDGLRVVVVEDEDDARTLLCDELAGRGAVVGCAASAREAIAMIRRMRPDVIVSDVGMPDMDGYAMMREVRMLPASEGGSAAAIALTAYARSDDRARALAAGFQRHMTKPVDPADLASAIAEHSDGARGKGPVASSG